MPSIEEPTGPTPPAPSRYRELLRERSLSVGVYRLAPGATDPQTPHTEDEVYYVVRGRARFVCAGVERSVEPGDVLYVPAREVHRFRAITEDLVLVVVFAPPEGTGAGGRLGGVPGPSV